MENRWIVMNWQRGIVVYGYDLRMTTDSQALHCLLYDYDPRDSATDSYTIRFTSKGRPVISNTVKSVTHISINGKVW